MMDSGKVEYPHGKEKMLQMECPYKDCGRPFYYDNRTTADFPNGIKGYAYIMQLPVPATYNQMKEKLDTEIKNHSELGLKFIKLTSEVLALKQERDELKGKLGIAIAALKKIQQNHCGHPQDLKQHRVETAREALKEIS